MTTLTGTSYTIRAVDPLSFTSDQAMELALLHCRTFTDDAFLNWWHGPHYLYKRVPVTMPTHWLGRTVQKDQLLGYAWKHFYQKLVLRDGIQTYLLYDKDVLIGWVLWGLPPYLQSKQSVWQRVKRSLAFYWVCIQDWLLFLGKPDHPISNQRIVDHKEWERGLVVEAHGECNEKVLHELTLEELAKTPYQDPKYYVYLSMIGVSPDYQRQGLGGKLLLQTLEPIPKDDVPVVSDGQTRFVPQKVNLRASSAGVGLYKKLGFKQVVFWQTEHAQGYVLDLDR